MVSGKGSYDLSSLFLIHSLGTTAEIVTSSPRSSQKLRQSSILCHWHKRKQKILNMDFHAVPFSDWDAFQRGYPTHLVSHLSRLGQRTLKAVGGNVVEWVTIFVQMTEEVFEQFARYANAPTSSSTSMKETFVLTKKPFVRRKLRHLEEFVEMLAERVPHRACMTRPPCATVVPSGTILKTEAHCRRSMPNG